MVNEIENAEAYRAFVDRRHTMLDAQNAETSSYIHKLSAWMIAQLFLANAGGLTIGSEGAPEWALVAFVVGVVAAMGCSLAAWWQSHLTYHETHRLGDPNAFFGREYLPTNDEDANQKQNRWFGVAIFSGSVSMLCFAVGALLRIFA